MTLRGDLKGPKVFTHFLKLRVHQAHPRWFLVWEWWSSLRVITPHVQVLLKALSTGVLPAAPHYVQSQDEGEVLKLDSWSNTTRSGVTPTSGRDRFPKSSLSEVIRQVVEGYWTNYIHSTACLSACLSELFKHCLPVIYHNIFWYLTGMAAAKLLQQLSNIIVIQQL